MKTIICRADGNALTGLGHLYRMFALYEMYKDTFNVHFVTSEDSEIIVIPKSYNLYLIPNHITLSQEVDWLSNQFDCNSDIIIADGYQFVGNYQKKLVDIGFYLMYIDDLVSEPLYANSIVNHAQKLNRSLYNAPKDAIFSLGTKYAILRPLFLEAAKNKRTIKTIDTAFVCFGGADALDLTYKATQALLLCDDIKNIHIVLGGAYNHKAIYKIAQDHSEIQIHKNLNELDLITIMTHCNFAIVPSSTILYEICCVKMPILSGYFVDNQKNIYHAFVEDNVIYPGGDFSKYEIYEFKTAIEDVLKQKNFDSITENQAKLFDGKIKERFLNLMLSIDLRKATINDSRLIFDWSNDDLVRKNSFNSEKLIFENHNKWLTEKLQDPNQLFLIASVDKESAGLIRFAIETKNAVIGIVISERFRGKQLASRLLIASSKAYFKTNTLPIFAYIKKDNMASIRAFQNAGYSFLKDTTVNEHESVIYQLNKYESNT